VGKPKGRRMLSRTRHKWVDCIKMNEKQGWRQTWATSSGSGKRQIKCSCKHHQQ